MKLFKRLTSAAVAAVIFCSVPAYAADSEQIQAAWNLYSLDLFSGTGTNDDGTPIFDLDNSLTRAEAVTLILNLMGLSGEASLSNYETAFTDLPAWAEKYISYAYTNGYVSGVSSTQFDSNSSVSANQFCAFILRALGYSEANGDFIYENALAYAHQKGIADSSYDNFTRGDAVEIAYNALSQKINGTSTTLYESLVNAGVIEDGTSSVTVVETSLSSDMTAEEVYAECSSAVFYIEVYDENGKAIQLGSGFFIDSDGTAVTNYHVLEGGSSAKITLSDTGEVYDVAGVYDYDTERDIALIKIDGSGFSYLEMGDSDNINGGATVYAIGSPFGLSNTISQGIISNVSRTISGQEYIQITASISSGSSGGALINTSGQVIGITSGEVAQSTSTGTVTGQNLNLAIPINSIQTLEKNSLTSMADIYAKEVKGNAEITVSSESVSLSVGQSATVTITCSADVEAYLTGSLSKVGIVSAKFAKTAEGSVLYLEGLKAGTAEINLKMRSSDGTIIAEKTIDVTVK
ncbi:MAG: S1C family serine protease [Clostridiales bacterium]|nr:S1C family serine protease [Clostridiales bacterium]